MGTAEADGYPSRFLCVRSTKRVPSSLPREEWKGFGSSSERLVCRVRPSVSISVDVVQSPPGSYFKATLPLIAGFAFPSFGAISVTSFST